MKHKLKSTALLALACMSALLCGCAATTYTYKDAPQIPVKFESMKTEKTFYDAVLAKYFPAFDETSSKWEFEMGMGWGHDTRNSSNVIFNEAVAAADTNHDGTITEAEADGYAATIAARTEKEKVNDATSSGW